MIYKNAPCRGIKLETLSVHQLSHWFSTSTTNLLTGCSRYRRAISVDIPSTSLTVLTNLFLSVVATIFPIGQLFHSTAVSFSRTIHPTL